MNKFISGCFTLLLTFSFLLSFAQNHVVWLDDLPIQSFSDGIRPVEVKANYGKDTMCVKGVKYLRGLGAQSISILKFDLSKQAIRFSAMAAVDDHGNKDIALRFYVLGDGKILFESEERRVGDEPLKVEVDLSGIKQLGLLVTDQVGGVGNKRTYANWINAKLEMKEGHLPGYLRYPDQKYILTPLPKQTPKINSAKVFGASPGNPVLYTIAATGRRPMQFSALGLPKGLSISASTGIITGVVKEKGNYSVLLKAKNNLGEAKQKLVIKIGDTIALTPPLGWNGWNSWETKIDREKVMASAQAMVNKGLRDHGWNYINIDDSWQGVRTGPDTALQPNEKFPDFKTMVDAIHALGLKAGLYSTPYVSSYGGYVGGSSDFPAGGETHERIKVNRQSFMHIGKYRFETIDARQMASWGFDFLKYDWRIDVNSTERMADALKKSGRDVVFSLSNNSPFEKVKDWMRLSHMYRTGPDIKDSWNSLYTTVFSIDKWAAYTGPGHWADPDMMIVGDVAMGPVMHPTKLTADEQYSHVSIFSLLAAPMLIGCPIEKLDAFTLNLLTNDEVIAINQDPLGKAGRLLLREAGIEVWVKQLEDGAYGIGIFNTAGYGETPQSYFRWGDEKEKPYALDFTKIGLKGKWQIRDVWRQKSLGQYSGPFTTTVPYHGVVMLKVSPVGLALLK
ncbi:alpha-galactosidase [Pedobacter sp. AK017]|uniref:NPCBM/NEW2 domain-containing protein n=1 Tax=Pedobacter sp. AK017 TaxID=2723073 RepID=UPI00161FB76A|nr:NPCBM/NEW2 domain-containing protein [Pedobacter sp. AK017]MBB5441161.1 alpha-galactosidase [Pedobacter sp. AK017]